MAPPLAPSPLVRRAALYQAANLFASVLVAVSLKPPRRGESRGKEKSMKLLVASAFAVGFGLMAASAQAMPVYPVDKSAPNEIIRVAQGCGPGFHRGPGGACRPLFSCPPGWHPGPYGKKCFRN
jgi:hypothetical protein